MNTMRNSLSVICGLLLGVTAAAAQTPLDVPGVTGTITLEGTVDQEYAGANAIFVKTAEGLRHLFHLTEHTAVHGAKGGGDALAGLEEGSRVVVRYVAKGTTITAVEIDRVADDGLRASEGVVERVDRRGKKLVIRLSDGSTDTLRLTERAAADIGHDIRRTDRVVVYYTDEEGHQTVHFFKRAVK